MIFIAVRFKVLPEHSDGWLSLVDDFTRATRSEPGNLWFDWSRSVDDPNEFVLLEAFRDGAAGSNTSTRPISNRRCRRCRSRWPRRRGSSTRRFRARSGR